MSVTIGPFWPIWFSKGGPLVRKNIVPDIGKLGIKCFVTLYIYTPSILSLVFLFFVSLATSKVIHQKIVNLPIVNYIIKMNTKGLFTSLSPLGLS